MSSWNVADLKRLGRPPGGHWRPQTGIEAAQGDPYKLERGLSRALQTPLDPGINLAGWLNPYSLTQYNAAVNTLAAVQIAPANLRRAYLVLQNQGPGNLWIAFGASAQAATATANANCMQLVQTQFYEQVGGGAFDLQTLMPKPGLFVSPDYVTGITDTAGTTVLVMEGVFLLQRWANFVRGSGQY